VTTPDNVGVHASRCCAVCGCKYGNDDCPVENRAVAAMYPCEECEERRADELPAYLRGLEAAAKICEANAARHEKDDEALDLFFAHKADARDIRAAIAKEKPNGL
jgi:hypothetical protein